MEPPTLGVALLCSSWAGTDLWLYPELFEQKNLNWLKLSGKKLASKLKGEFDFLSKNLLFFIKNLAEEK